MFQSPRHQIHLFVESERRTRLRACCKDPQKSLSGRHKLLTFLTPRLLRYSHQMILSTTSDKVFWWGFCYQIPMRPFGSCRHSLPILTSFAKDTLFLLLELFVDSLENDASSPRPKAVSRAKWKWANMAGSQFLFTELNSFESLGKFELLSLASTMRRSRWFTSDCWIVSFDHRDSWA